MNNKIQQFKRISQTMSYRLWCALCQPNSLATVRLFLLVSLIGLWGSALADGNDILMVRTPAYGRPSTVPVKNIFTPRKVF